MISLVIPAKHLDKIIQNTSVSAKKHCQKCGLEFVEQCHESSIANVMRKSYDIFNQTMSNK